MYVNVYVKPVLVVHPSHVTVLTFVTLKPVVRYCHIWHFVLTLSYAFVPVLTIVATYFSLTSCVQSTSLPAIIRLSYNITSIPTKILH